MFIHIKNSQKAIIDFKLKMIHIDIMIMLLIMTLVVNTNSIVSLLHKIHYILILVLNNIIHFYFKIRHWTISI